MCVYPLKYYIEGHKAKRSPFYSIIPRAWLPKFVRRATRLGWVLTIC